LYSPKEYRLSSSKIVRLAEDMHGNIWIMGSRNSRIVIDVMNPETETVQPLHRFLGLEQPVEIPMPDEFIIMYNIDGKIWAGTLDEIYLYDGKWQQICRTSGKSGVRNIWYPAKQGFWRISGRQNRIYLENNAGEVLDSISGAGRYWIDNNLDMWTIPQGGEKYSGN
jgi:hypothetical protein